MNPCPPRPLRLRPQLCFLRVAPSVKSSFSLSLGSLRLFLSSSPRVCFPEASSLPPSRYCCAAFWHQRLPRLRGRVWIYVALYLHFFIFLLMFFPPSAFYWKVFHTPSLSEDPSITVETCREAVTELHNSLRKTVKLYTQVSHSVCGCERERGARKLNSVAGKIGSECQVFVSSSCGN